MKKILFFAVLLFSLLSFTSGSVREQFNAQRSEKNQNSETNYLKRIIASFVRFKK